MVAVPSTVAKSTVIPRLEEADRLTVKTALVVPALPSVTVTSLMDKVGELGGGASLSRMVHVPLLRMGNAGLALLRVTVKVSVASASASFAIGIETVMVAIPPGVGPGRKVTVPLD